jgi:hypothetical protein
MKSICSTCVFLLFLLLIQPAAALDLSRAVIIPSPQEGVVLKAAEMLSEELAERSGIELPIAEKTPSEGSVIRIGTVETLSGVEVPEKAEGYGIALEGDTLSLVGRDERGAMFAAGRLIRLADYKEGSLSVDLGSPISTAPDVPFRAHQLAYRNTANTYDAWDIETYEQYIRDLIFFGCNGVEIIPNLDPEAKDGPVMTESMRSMNKKIAALVHSYGLDVWLWSAVMADHEEDVTTPEGAKAGLEKRRAMFEDYPVIDHFFVPGGDDGETPAEHLMPFLANLAPILHESHPNAKIWVSNQTFTIEENNYFFDYLEKEQPAWLKGVVYGPWTKMGWEELRERTPKQYPLRRYPDITHTLRCQYPVPNWDPAFANTVGREPMMPLPEMHRHIYLRYKDVSDGFGTYSDGVHDDLNKNLWSYLGWDPTGDVDEFLHDYGKLWWGQDLAKDVATGMRMLEKNWRGPIAANGTIPKTQILWEAISSRTADMETNWRAQMYLFRARFDAYVQKKRAQESTLERVANAVLADATVLGVEKAIEAARAALATPLDRTTLELRKGIELLGPKLLESIGYQLSVEPPYLARNPERGALLDWLDQPLNNRPWLEQRFKAILAMDSESDQLAALREIVHWTDPGPGGFYDNLGTVGEYSHVVFQQSWEEDPSACHSPRVAFPKYKADPATIADENSKAEEANSSFKDEKTGPSSSGRQEMRTSWQSQITTQFGTPLLMRYENLDPEAVYRLKVTYAGRYRPTMTLTLNDTFSIHGPLPQPDPIWPVEFYVPQEATKGGVLELEWDLVEGRGCMVSEVWLIKE